MTTPQSSSTQPTTSTSTTQRFNLSVELHTAIAKINSSGGRPSLFNLLKEFFNKIDSPYQLDDTEITASASIPAEANLTISILYQYLKAKCVCEFDFKKLAINLNGLRLKTFSESKEQWASVLLQLNTNQAKTFLNNLIPTRKASLFNIAASDILHRLIDEDGAIENSFLATNLGAFADLFQSDFIKTVKLPIYALARIINNATKNINSAHLPALIKLFEKNLTVLNATQRTTLLTQARTTGDFAGASPAYWLALAIHNEALNKNSAQLPDLIKLFEKTLTGLNATQQTTLLTQARMTGRWKNTNPAYFLELAFARSKIELLPFLSSVLNHLMTEDIDIENKHLLTLLQKINKNVTDEFYPQLMFQLIEATLSGKDTKKLLNPKSCYSLMSIDGLYRKMFTAALKPKQKTTSKMPSTLKDFLSNLDDSIETGYYFDRLIKIVEEPKNYPFAAKINLSDVLPTNLLSFLKASLKVFILGYSKKYLQQNTPDANQKSMTLMTAMLDRQHWIGAILRYHRSAFHFSATGTVQYLIKHALKPYVKACCNNVVGEKQKTNFPVQEVMSLLNLKSLTDLQVDSLCRYLKQGLEPRPSAPSKLASATDEWVMIPSAPTANLPVELSCSAVTLEQLKNRSVKVPVIYFGNGLIYDESVLEKVMGEEHPNKAEYCKKFVPLAGLISLFKSRIPYDHDQEYNGRISLSSLSQMKNPVVVSSGHVYEKALLDEYLKNKSTCPVARTALTMFSIDGEAVYYHSVPSVVKKYLDFLNKQADVEIKAAAPRKISPPPQAQKSLATPAASATSRSAANFNLLKQLQSPSLTAPVTPVKRPSSEAKPTQSLEPSLG